LNESRPPAVQKDADSPLAFMADRVYLCHGYRGIAVGDDHKIVQVMA
jgi:hypothetical protein